MQMYLNFAQYGVLHARGYSTLSQNVYICAKRHNFDIRHLLFSSANGLFNCTVKYCISKCFDSNTLRQSADLILKILVDRDDLSEMSNNLVARMICNAFLTFSAHSRLFSFQCIFFVYRLCRVRNVPLCMCMIYIKNIPSATLSSCYFSWKQRTDITVTDNDCTGNQLFICICLLIEHSGQWMFTVFKTRLSSMVQCAIAKHYFVVQSTASIRLRQSDTYVSRLLRYTRLT
jgi:hypothetical protein